MKNFFKKILAVLGIIIAFIILRAIIIVVL